MTMQITHIEDPAQIEKIKEKLQPTEYVFGVKEVTIGEHPEHGHVVLIETDGGSLLIGDSVRFISS